MDNCSSTEFVTYSNHLKLYLNTFIKCIFYHCTWCTIFPVKVLHHNCDKFIFVSESHSQRPELEGNNIKRRPFWWRQPRQCRRIVSISILCLILHGQIWLVFPCTPYAICNIKQKNCYFVCYYFSNPPFISEPTNVCTHVHTKYSEGYR